MLNLTNVAQMTEPQVIDFCVKEVGFSAYIFIGLISSLSLILIYKLFSKNKFAILWTIFSIFLAIILTIFYFNPNFVYDSYTWILSWF